METGMKGERDAEVMIEWVSSPQTSRVVEGETQGSPKQSDYLLPEQTVEVKSSGKTSLSSETRNNCTRAAE